jgi:AcrR family transcriptional regulator
MTWARARSEEQKEQRIRQIVEATARLYERCGYEEISFVSIAKEAKFTRSNLYKYFNSKEEIFLEFLKYDISRWRQEIVEILKTNDVDSIPLFAGLWVQSFDKHKRLLKLLSILHPILEKNVSTDHLIAFKRALNSEFAILGELLTKIFPAFTQELLIKFLNLQVAYATGLFQMSNHCQNQQEVLALPEFAHMKIDFQTNLQNSIIYLLNGLLG